MPSPSASSSKRPSGICSLSGAHRHALSAVIMAFHTWHRLNYVSGGLFISKGQKSRPPEDQTKVREPAFFPLGSCGCSSIYRVSYSAVVSLLLQNKCVEVLSNPNPLAVTTIRNQILCNEERIFNWIISRYSWDVAVYRSSLDILLVFVEASQLLSAWCHSTRLWLYYVNLGHSTIQANRHELYNALQCPQYLKVLKKITVR